MNTSCILYEAAGVRDDTSCIHNSGVSSPGVTLTIWSLFSLFIAALYHPDCAYSLELISKPAEITPPVAGGARAAAGTPTANEGRRRTCAPVEDRIVILADVHVNLPASLALLRHPPHLPPPLLRACPAAHPPCPQDILG